MKLAEGSADLSATWNAMSPEQRRERLRADGVRIETREDIHDRLEPYIEEVSRRGDEPENGLAG